MTQTKETQKPKKLGTQPVGRPSKYCEEFNEQMVELMAKGHTVAMCCVKWGICEATFYEWTRQHPEFLKAYTRGMTSNKAFLEKISLNQLNNPDRNFNEKHLQFVMVTKHKATQERTVSIAPLRDKNGKALTGDSHWAKAITGAGLSGNVTPDEALKLLSAFNQKIDIQERSETKDEVQELRAMVMKLTSALQGEMAKNLEGSKDK